MAIPSLIIGDENWATKETSLLGYFEGTDGSIVPKIMTWGRASSGTAINADGLVEAVDYNLSPNSEDFTVWGGSGVVDPNVTTAPNGELAASSIYASNTSNNRAQVSPALLPSTQYTVSCYVKDRGDDIASVWFYSVETSFVKIKFTFSTETISNSGTAEDSSGFDTLDDGWYRVYFVFTTDTVVTSPQIQLNRGVAAITTYYWGAQLVKGTTEKSYLATTDRLDIPRIDFSDSSRGALLLEPQRTNLVLYSGDLSAANWVKTGAGTGSNAIATANYSTSPDGTVNASRLQLDLNGGTSAGDISYTSQSVAGTGVMSSFYLKSNNGTVVIYIRVGGVISAVTVTTSWQRFEVENAGAITLIQIGLRGNNYGGETNSDVADILVYGVQSEVGSYATSPIPTQGTTVTRLADTGTNCGDASDFNSEEGALLVEMAALFDDGATKRYLSINDGSTNNRVYIRYDATSNNILANITASGVTQAVLNTAVYTVTDFHKILVRWKLNDFALWVDGTEVDTDASGSVSAAGTLNTFSYDRGDGVEPLHGYCKLVANFKGELTDAECQALTT